MKKFTDEQKKEAISRVKSGESTNRVAHDIGVSPTGLRIWMGYRPPNRMKQKTPFKKKTVSSPTLMTMAVPQLSDSSDRVVVLIGAAADIRNTLESLARING